MSDYPKDAAPRPASEQPESGDRRRLLRAAAVSAPVIATLPSGSAFANASINQCVVNAANADQTVIPSWIQPDSSPWLRVNGRLMRWDLGGNQDPEDIVYVIGVPFESPDFYRSDPRGPGQGDDLPPATGTDQVATGTWPLFDPNSGTPVPFPDGTFIKQIDVLAIFILDNPDGAGGFYPRGVWPAARKETGEAFAVAQSCYCSVDPGTEFCKPIG
jgi:hypothetical protein